MSATPGEIVDRIEASGMYSAEDLRVLKEAATQLNPEVTGERFVTDLERQGWLTEYQAEVIWSGSGRPLRLGNYLILDEIGRGGMGVVLKARHRRLKRTVALKVIAEALASDEVTIDRFQREIETAGSLDHPNIVTAHDADEEDGTHFLVMEFVEGRTLQQILKEDGRPPLPVAVGWMIQAARGMGYAHARGVVHRDIKPGNLFVDRDGQVKIMDLGLARWMSEIVGEVSSLTESQSMMGTMDYMAPEQAEDAKTAGKEADIYSLGMTMFHLLTGEKPYPEDTLTKSILAHREKPIPKMGEQRENIPVELEMLFSRMAAKKPQFRSLSMDEIAAALERIKADVEGRPGWEKKIEARYRAGLPVESEAELRPAGGAENSAAADDDGCVEERSEAADAGESGSAVRDDADEFERDREDRGGGLLRWVALVAVAGLAFGLAMHFLSRPSAGGGLAPRTSAPAELVRLEGLSEVSSWEMHPFVTPDGLALYYEQDRAVVRAVRKSVNESFRRSGVVAKPARHPTVTADELCLIAHLPNDNRSLRGTLGESRRESVKSAFPPLEPIPVILAGTNPKSPWVSPDGLTLVYQRDASGGYDSVVGNITEFAYTTRAKRSSPWREPQALDTEEAMMAGGFTWPRLEPAMRRIWCGVGVDYHQEFHHATGSGLDSGFGDLTPVRFGEHVLAGRAPCYVPATDELYFSAPDPDSYYADVDLYVVRNVSTSSDEVSEELRKFCFRPLFNGKDLDGWTKSRADASAKVVDGVIELNVKGHFALLTEDTFDDFVLRAEVMLPDGGADSGIFFRTNPRNGRLEGYQADVDPSSRAKTGALFDFGKGRGFLSGKGSEKLVRAPVGEWVRVQVKCRGEQIEIRINQVVHTSLRDDEESTGHIGLEAASRGSNDFTYRFRNIRIMEL